MDWGKTDRRELLEHPLCGHVVGNIGIGSIGEEKLGKIRLLNLSLRAKA